MRGAAPKAPSLTVGGLCHDGGSWVSSQRLPFLIRAICPLLGSPPRPRFKGMSISEGAG